jgi:hypothetical protein
MADNLDDYLDQELPPYEELDPNTMLPDPNAGTSMTDFLKNRRRQGHSGGLYGGLTVDEDMFEEMVYDRGIMPSYFEDPEQQIAATQTGWEYGGKFLGRALTKAGTELLSTPGYLYALGEGTVNVLAGEGAEGFGSAFDNWWIESMRDVDEAIKDQMPVYIPKEVEHGSLMDNLTSGAFWATEGADGVGFLAAMLLPGQVPRLLGAGGRTAKYLSKFAPTIAEADKVAMAGTQIAKTAELGSKIDMGLAVGINSILEAAAETSFYVDDAKQQLYGELVAKKINPNTGQLFTAEEVDQLVGQNASNVYAANAALLMFPNYIQQSSLMRAFSPSKLVSSRIGAQSAKATAAAAKAGGDASKKVIPDIITPLSKKQVAARGLYALGTNAASEGLVEEGGQYAIEQFYTDQVRKGEFSSNAFFFSEPENWGKHISGLVNEYVDAYSDIHGQKAMALGAILGGVMGGAGRTREAARERKIINENNPLLKKGIDNFLDVVNKHFAKDEAGNYVIDEKTGLPKINMKEVSKIFKNFGISQELGEAIAHAAMAGDTDTYNHLTDVAFIDVARQFAQVPGGEEALNIQIEQMGERLRSDAEAIEKVGKNELNEHVEKKKAHLRTLGKAVADYYQYAALYKAKELGIEPKTDEASDVAQAEQFAGIRRMQAATTKGHIHSMDKVINELEQEKEKIEKLTADESTESDKIAHINQKIINATRAKEKYMQSLEDIFNKEKSAKAFDEWLEQSKQEKKATEEASQANQTNSHELDMLAGQTIMDMEENIDGTDYTVAHRGEVSIDILEDFDGENQFLDEDGKPIPLDFEVVGITSNGNIQLQNKAYKDQKGELRNAFLNYDAATGKHEFNYRGKKLQGLNDAFSWNVTKTAAEVREGLVNSAVRQSVKDILRDYLSEEKAAKTNLRRQTTMLDNLVAKHQQLLKNKESVTDKANRQKLIQDIATIKARISQVRKAKKKAAEAVKKAQRKINDLGVKNVVTVSPNDVSRVRDMLTKLQNSWNETINMTKSAEEVIEEAKRYVKQLEQIVEGARQDLRKALGISTEASDDVVDLHIQAIMNDPSASVEAFRNKINERLDNIIAAEKELSINKKLTDVKIAETQKILEGFREKLRELDEQFKKTDKLRKGIEKYYAQLLRDRGALSELESVPANENQEGNEDTLGIYIRNLDNYEKGNEDAQKGQDNDAPREPFVNVSSFLRTTSQDETGLDETWYEFRENYDPHTSKKDPGYVVFRAFNRNTLPESLRDEVTFFDENDLKLVAYYKKSGKPVKINDRIVQTSMALPSFTYESEAFKGKPRFSYRKIEAEAENRFGLETGTLARLKAGEDLSEVDEAILVGAQEFIEERKSQALKEYQEIRNKVANATEPVEFTISHKNPGKKNFPRDFNQEPGEAINRVIEKEEDLGMWRDKKNFFFAKDDVYERLGRFYNVHKGSFYVLNNGRPELAIQDTLKNTGDDQRLMRILAHLANMPSIDTQDGAKLMDQVNAMVYITHDLNKFADYPFKMSIMTETVKGKKRINQIIFGENNYVITAKQLQDPTENKIIYEKFEQFIQNKYHHVSQQILTDKYKGSAFVEYDIKDGNIIEKKVWSEEEGGYLGYLMLEDQAANSPVRLKFNVLPKREGQGRMPYVNTSFSYSTGMEGTVEESAEDGTLEYGGEEDVEDRTPGLTQEEEAKLFDTLAAKALQKFGKIVNDHTLDEVDMLSRLPKNSPRRENMEDVMDYFEELWEEATSGIQAKDDEVASEISSGGIQNLPDISDQATVVKDEGLGFEEKEEEEDDDDITGGVVFRLPKAGERMRRNRLSSYGKEIAWFKEKFPNMPLEAVAGLVHGKGYAAFVEGVKVIMSEKAPTGVLYHEGFHIVTEYMLSEDERTELYQELRDNMRGKTVTTFEGKVKDGGELTNDEAEEFLAEDHRIYKMAPKKYKFGKTEQVKRNIFQKIWDFITNLFTPLYNRLNPSNPIKSEMPPKMMEVFKKIEDTPSFDIKLRKSNKTLYSLADNKIGPFTEDQTVKIVGDINYRFFKVLFESNKNFLGDVDEFSADKLFNSGKIDIGAIYKALLKSYKPGQPGALLYNESVDYSKMSENARLQDPSVKLHYYVEKHWPQFVSRHKEFLRQYSIIIADEVIEDEITTRNYGYGESNLQSMEDFAFTPVKMLIASLYEIDKVTRGEQHVNPMKSTDLGTAANVHYAKTLNELSNVLSNINSWSGMVEKIHELSETNPSYKLLLKRMGIVDPANPMPLNLEKSLFNLQMQFHQTFRKNKNNPVIGIIRDGSVYFVDAVNQREAGEILDRWKANLRDIEPKDSIFTVSDEKATKGVTKINFSKALKPNYAGKKVVRLKDFNVELAAKEGKGIKRRGENPDLDVFLAYFGIEVDHLKGAVNQTLKASAAKWILNEIKRIDAQQGYVSIEDIYRNNVLKAQKEIMALVNAASEQNADKQVLMYINQEGRSEFSVTLGSHLSRVVERMNQPEVDPVTQKDIRPEYLLPYNPETGTGNIYLLGSNWHSKLSRGHSVKMHLIKGMKTEYESGNEISKMAPVDLAALHLNSILNGIYPFFRAGSRKMEFGFSIEDADNKRVGVSVNPRYEEFEEYLKAEIATIIALKKDNIGAKLRNYSEWGNGLRAFDFLPYNEAKMDKFIERVQEREEKANKSEKDYYMLATEFLLENDITEGGDAIVKFMYQAATNLEHTLLEEGLLEKRETVKESVALFDTEIEHEVDMYNLYGIDEDVLTRIFGKSLHTDPNNLQAAVITQDEIQRLTRIIAFNSTKAYIEQSKYFTSDIAFYTVKKGLSEFLKRTSGISSTRKDMMSEQAINEYLEEHYETVDDMGFTDNWKFAVREDIYRSMPQKTIDMYKNHIPAHMAEMYADMNIADATSVTTLEGYREFMMKTQGWTDSEEMLYQFDMQSMFIDLMGTSNLFTPERFVQYFGKHTGNKVPSAPMFNGKVIDPINSLIQIQKPQGFGRIEGEGLSNLYVPSFLKTSMVTLMYTEIKDHPHLVSLLTDMLNTGMRLQVFESGEKGDMMNPIPMFDENNEYIPLYNRGSVTSIDPNYAFAYKHLGDLGMQNDIPAKFKGKVTKSVQFERLEFLDIFDGGNIVKGYDEKFQALRDEKVEIKNEVVKRKWYYLMKELGIEEQKDGSYVIENTENLLKALVSAFRSRNLPLNEIEGINLALMSNAKLLDVLSNKMQIQNVLMALIRNNVITHKTKGESLIQQSVFGREGVGFRDTLKFYEVGKAMEVELALPKQWYPWVIEKYGSIEEFNEAIARGEIDERLITYTANRVPGQATNSLEVAKVKRFLPPWSGTKIILPTAIVVKTGSDFDIDKLTTYFTNFEMTEEGPKYIEYNTTDLDYRAEQLLASPKDLNYLITIAEDTKLVEDFKRYKDALDEISTLIKNNANEDIQKATADINAEIQELKDSKKGKNRAKRNEIDLEIAMLQRNLVTMVGRIKEAKTESLGPVKEDLKKGIKTLIKNMPMSEQMSMNALENRMNEISQEVLLDPKHFGRLILPQDPATLKELSNEIGGKDAATPFNEFFTWTYNYEYGKANWAAAQGVGLAANQSANNASTQQVPVEIEYPFFDLFFSKQKSNNPAYLGHLKDEDNQFVSTTFADFISSYVDAEKDAYIFKLKATTQVFPVYSLLLRASKTTPLSKDTAAHFITQPIIMNYIEEKQKGTSMILPSKGINQAIAKVLVNQGLVSNEASADAIINNMSFNLMRQYDAAETEAEKQVFLKKWQQKNNLNERFTRSQLVSFKTGNFGKKSRISVLLQLLDNYLAYEYMSEYMDDFVRNTRPDSTMSKSRQHSMIMRNRFNRMMDSGFFKRSDLEVFLENSILREYNNAHDNSVEAYGDLFLADRYPIIREYFDSVLNDYDNKFLKRSIDKNAKLLQVLENDFIAFLTSIHKHENIQSRYASLLKGRESVSYQYNRLRKRADLQSNPLMQELVPEPEKFLEKNGRTTGINNMKLFNGKRTAQESDTLTRGFKELFEHPDPKVKKFAKDLMILSIVQGGMNNSPISFNQIVPNDYLINELTGTVLNYHDASLGTKTIVQQEMELRTLMTAFIEQFYRNNWSDSNIIPRLNYLYKAENSISIKATNGHSALPFLAVEKASIPWKIAKQMRIEGKRVPKEVFLYKKESTFDGRVKYILVNKLGSGFRFKEWSKQSNPKKLESILSHNNDMYLKFMYSGTAKQAEDKRKAEEKAEKKARSKSPTTKREPGKKKSNKGFIPLDSMYAGKLDAEVTKYVKAFRSKNRKSAPKFMGVIPTKNQIKLIMQYHGVITKKGKQQPSFGIEYDISAATIDKARTFLQTIGVDVIELERILDATGRDLNFIGLADFMEKTVQVVKGEKGLAALPEEAAHFFIAMLGSNHPLYRAMYKKIVDLPIYQEVSSDPKYVEFYGDNTEGIKIEAMGQQVAQIMNELSGEVEETMSPENEYVKKTWWNMLWRQITEFFSRIFQDPFKESALQVLKNDVSELTVLEDLIESLKNTEMPEQMPALSRHQIMRMEARNRRYEQVREQRENERLAVQQENARQMKIEEEDLIDNSEIGRDHIRENLSKYFDMDEINRYTPEELEVFIQGMTDGEIETLCGF